MGKLCMTLPPFSPDYSGVCSALFPFDTITVIHDASGCTGNYTGYDEPRWFRSRSPIYCSGLREIDAILGDDEKLIQKILFALEEIEPEMIALVGSPVPMVIGTDMEGIAAEIESRTGIMSVGFATTGLKYYPQGVEQVYKKVVKRILEESEDRNGENVEVLKFSDGDTDRQSGNGCDTVGPKYRVNILGATPLDFGNSKTMDDLQVFLVENGFEINSALWENVTKEEIASLKYADCNIVVSTAGIELAEYMKKKFGIPFITGLPFGTRYANVWLQKLAERISENSKRNVTEESLCQKEKNCCPDYNDTDKAEKFPIKSGSKVLIIGEQFQANSIRNALEAESEVECTVGGICGWDDNFAEVQDRFLETEEEIVTLLNDGSFDVVIGDPFYEELMKMKKQFYPYAHYAVSSKLGKKHSKSLIEEKLLSVFE